MLISLKFLLAIYRTSEKTPKLNCGSYLKDQACKTNINDILYKDYAFIIIIIIIII
jgi:hypothetical protein